MLFVSARSFYTGGNQAPPPKVQETKGPQKSRQPIKMSEMTPHNPAPQLSTKGSSPHTRLVFCSFCCFCFFVCFFFPYCSDSEEAGDVTITEKRGLGLQNCFFCILLEACLFWHSNHQPFSEWKLCKGREIAIQPEKFDKAKKCHKG